VEQWIENSSFFSRTESSDEWGLNEEAFESEESSCDSLQRMIKDIAQRQEHAFSGMDEASVSYEDAPKEDERQDRLVLQPDEDVLNAWEQRVNLCDRLHVISKNSWGEVSISKGSGAEHFIKNLVLVLNACRESGREPEQSLRYFIGRSDVDGRWLKQRIGGLLLQSWAFVQGDQTDVDVRCLFVELGGDLFVVMDKAGRCSYRSFDSLTQATLSLNLTETGNLAVAFDEGNPRWEFYQTAAKNCRLGQAQQFFQKGSRDGYYMFCDERGHLAIYSIDRDGFRASLPRVASAVNAVTLMGGAAEPDVCVKSYWFQRDEKGKAYLMDISAKMDRSVGVALPRASKLEFVFPKSSMDNFLEVYAQKQSFSFDCDVVQHEIKFVVAQLHQLRRSEAGLYPVFLSRLHVIGEDKLGFACSGSLKVHLKLLVERACLKFLKRHREKSKS
jgi:hypothetical protein